MRYRDIIVRMAKNDDGDAVAALMKKDGCWQFDGWEVDWSDLEPFWLLAEHDGVLLGCIQVVPAKPVGHMDELVIDPDLLLKSRYMVARALTDHAVATIKMYGAQAAQSIITTDQKSFFEGAKNRDWTEIDQGHIMMRRLA